MSLSVLPLADISTALPGGPTACDASDASFRSFGGTLASVGARVGAVADAMALLAASVVSLVPNGLTPLKWFCARPSWKLRWLNTALMIVGVLRPVTRRRFVARAPPCVVGVTVSAGSLTTRFGTLRLATSGPLKVMSTGTEAGKSTGLSGPPVAVTPPAPMFGRSSNAAWISAAVAVVVRVSGVAAPSKVNPNVPAGVPASCCTSGGDTAPSVKTGSGGTGVVFSVGNPAMMLLNVDGTTPCAPTTASPPSGKSAGVRSVFAVNGVVSEMPFASLPGFRVLRVRLSVPAEKWQVAQAVLPSLPACMSQNSALPSLTAAASSAT